MSKIVTSPRKASDLERAMASPVSVEVIHGGKHEKRWGFALTCSAAPTIELTYDIGPHLEAYTDCCNSKTYDATGGAYRPIQKCGRCFSTVHTPIKGIMPYVGVGAWLDFYLREDLQLNLLEKEVLLDGLTDRVLYLLAALKSAVEKHRSGFDHSKELEPHIVRVLESVAKQESRALNS